MVELLDFAPAFSLHGVSPGSSCVSCFRSQTFARLHWAALGSSLGPFGFDFESSIRPNAHLFMILAKTNWVRLVKTSGIELWYLLDMPEGLPHYYSSPMHT